MLKLLKSFFAGKNNNSTSTEWTDESWSVAGYENSLKSGGLAKIFSPMDSSGFGDSTSMFSGASGPSMNIDGTPMVGNVDIHGNPFGVTQTPFSSADSDPAFNIDGSPMMGSVDIHGNPFGVTDSHSHFDSFSSDSSWSSSSDSFGSSWSSSSDSFGSSWSSDNQF